MPYFRVFLQICISCCNVVANSASSLFKHSCSYASMLFELPRILTCCDVETHSVPKAPVKPQTLVGLREVIMTSNLDGPVRKIGDGELCSVPSCIDDDLFFPDNYTSRLSIVGNLLQNVIQSQRSGNMSAILTLKACPTAASKNWALHCRKHPGAARHTYA